MVHECRDAAILPQLIPQNYDGENPDTNYELSTVASHIAASLLLGDVTLPEAFALSQAWHKPGNTISHHIRYLNAGIWHALTEPWHNAANSHQVVALSDSQQLDCEGNTLKHCVGKGSYDGPCLKGESHILSIRNADGTERIATICVNDKLEIQHGQFYGEGNRSPSDEVKAVWEEFKEAVKGGDHSLNEKPEHGWGETAESRKKRQEAEVSDLEMTIGYRFNEIPEKAAQCARHYVDNLRNRVEKTLEVRQETLGPQTKRVTEQRVVPFSIPDFTPTHFADSLSQYVSLLRTEDQEKIRELLPQAHILDSNGTADICLTR